MYALFSLVLFCKHTILDFYQIALFKFIYEVVKKMAINGNNFNTKIYICNLTLYDVYLYYLEVV